MIRGRLSAWAAITAAPRALRFLGVAVLCAAACSPTTVKTPTTVLDRPSDVALFCVDFDYNPSDCNIQDNLHYTNNILPTLAGSNLNDYDFVNLYCTTVFTPLYPIQNVRVLPPEQCDGPHRRAFLSDVLFCEGLPYAQRSADPRCNGVLTASPPDPAPNPGAPQSDTNDPRYVQGAADLLAAAARLGYDLNNPCCDPYVSTAASCSVQPPTCTGRRLEAIITNSNRGEVAAVNTQQWQANLSTFGGVENLHSGEPGFGLLPVGTLPEHVRAQVLPGSGPYGQGGDAWAVTTNSGSCDLSVMDLVQVASMVDRPRDCDETSCPVQVTPKAQDGTPLGARPSWVEITPCSQERRALVAFSACGLVADIDLSTGKVVEGLHFEVSGEVRHLGPAELQSLRCPSDCGGSAGGQQVAVPDGGVPIVRGGSPTSVAVVPLSQQLQQAQLNDPSLCQVPGALPQRLLISDSGRPVLTSVPYDPAAPAGQRMLAPRTLALAQPDQGREGAGQGVDVVRASPVTDAGQFAYAVARDATVRVVNLETDTECETNPDPRYLQQQMLNPSGTGRVLPDDYNQSNIRRFSCYPVEQTPRSPRATSPGIALPGGALPKDVAFIHLDMPCDPGDINCVYSPSFLTPTQTPRAGPAVWIGDFAWILGSSGVVTGVQIADECPAPSFRACFPQQAAYERVEMLSTYPESNLLVQAPALPQSVSVSPLDRLGNVPRQTTLRFGELSPWPRLNIDQQATILGVGAAFTDLLPTKNPDGSSTAQPRLVRPALVPYAYLPFDPVCDVSPAVLIDGANTTPVGCSNYRPTTLVAFPDPLAPVTESWNFAWEGLIGGAALLGSVKADGTVYAPGGLLCGRGVEPGDKLWLTGCNLDVDCPGGMYCVHEVGQGNSPGLCLIGQAEDGGLCKTLTQRLMVGSSANDWAATWLRRYRILRATQQSPGSQPATEDRLFLAELAAPEHLLESIRCDGADVAGSPLYGDPCLNPNGNMPYTVHLPDVNQKYGAATQMACRADVDQSGQPIKRCQIECDTATLCPYGYVCAHSPFEADERAANLAAGDTTPLRGRCVRAPLLTPQVKRRGDGTVQQQTTFGTGPMDGQPLTAAQVQAIVDACFPLQTSYEIHGGDAFVVSGHASGAQVLGRAVNGDCVTPPPTAGREYTLWRLRQPRLRLGERLHTGDQVEACPPVTGTVGDDGTAMNPGWIRHRMTTVDYQRQEQAGTVLSDVAPSCQFSPTSPTVKVIELPTEALVHTVRSSQQDPALDPLLAVEGELFYMRQLTQPATCVLSSEAQERCVGGGCMTCRAPVVCQCTGQGCCNIPCGGSCCGDGQACITNTCVTAPCLCPDGSIPPCDRRVHYENLQLNAVMKVPHYWDPTGGVYPDEWRVPEEGYVVSFGVVGSAGAYTVLAAPPQGSQAQGLKSATMAPDGTVYIVDEGNQGVSNGLHGQVMRLSRQLLDPNFLVK